MLPFSRKGWSEKSLLTLSGASAVSHDLYATVVKKGKPAAGSELKVSKITTIILGIVAVVLGIVFEKQNIAFMVSLAFAIAASANFPVLFLSMIWKGCTTKGAVIGGFLGLISSVGLTIVSPSVWEATLGNPKGSAWFPYTSPALFSMAIGFIGIWLFSVTDSGIGMNESQLAHLFEPFNRLGAEAREEDGHGLGLCITKTLVDAMQGEVMREVDMDCDMKRKREERGSESRRR